MDVQPPPQAELTSFLITLVVLFFLVRRMLGRQTVRVWALIAYPIVILVFASIIVAATKVTTFTIIASIIGAALGAALGYARGVHSTVELGPRPGTIVVQGNVLLAVIFVGAFILRFAVRQFLGTQTTSFALTDAFLFFAAASVGVARAMMYFTWRRLVAGAGASA
jgi:hypothetical protein